MNILQEAVEHGAQYVDMEGEHFEPIKGAKMIASHHDLSDSVADAQHMVNFLSNLQCEFVKFAAKSSSEQCVSKVHAVQSHKPLVAFSMPQEKSRLAKHNALIYCSCESGYESAQGQMTVREVRSLLDKKD